MDKVKILLVDDDEEDYLITRDLINDFPNRKYGLDWIDNYAEASEEIKKDKYDVYLVDYRLGPDSGLELVKTAMDEGSSKPFILLTGQGDQEIDEQARKAGAVDYVVKGVINPSDLERSIRYGIQHMRTLEQIRQLNEKLEERVAERTKALAVTNEALKESQRLYITIARNFPDGIINVFDRELNYVFVDGKDLELLGFSTEELVGKNISDVISGAQLDLLTKNLQRSFDGESITLEYATANNLHYELSAVPLHEDDGTINQVLVVSKNITHQKIAEKEIRKSLEKEKQLGELKSRFVTTASHEFRTPLSTILSSVSLLGRYIDGDNFDKTKTGKHIQRIKSSVNNLNQILNDFLSMGRLEEGRISSEFSQFDIELLAGEAISGVRPLLKPGQKIDYIHDCGDPLLYLDKQMSLNIMINLLSNAIKYSEEDCTITLTTRCTQDELAIHVKDEGIGIPKADVQHIFERFFRAHNAVNIQGTGLGLNIVKRYAELMNGEIEFTSEEGKGTEFFVKLPLNKSSR
ncbi:MAG: ATP-binding protein [Cyclobacteriaceae bacterium]